MYICILSLMPIEQTLKTWLSAKLWTASHQLLHEKPYTKLLHVLSAFRLSLLLLHSALIAAPCSHQEQHPPQASPADVQSLFVLSNPDFRSTSAQQHVWDSCWAGSDGLHLKPKSETQRKKCTSKSKQTHSVRFLSVRIIISIDRLFNIFFRGRSCGFFQPTQHAICASPIPLLLALSCFLFSWLAHEASVLISCINPFYSIPHRSVIPEV